MELTARIVTLRLAETFVISRESRDEEEVAPGRAAPRRRRRLRRGRGDRPLRGDGRRRRSPTSRSTRRCSATTRSRSRRSRRGCRPGQNAARAALDGALHDLQGKLLGVPVWKLLGLPRTGPPTSWTVWLGDPDDMARRAEKAATRFRRLKLKLGGADGLDVERVRAVRAVTDLPLQVDVNEWWSLDEALEALPQLAELGVAYCEQPLRGGRRGREDAEGALADPDLRRRGLPRARQRRRVRGDRARDQHQAGEVGRHPRGDPDGARGARARARRHARLHDRVRARDRGRLRRRAAVRPRRPRRQPADRRGSVAGRRLHRRRPGSLRTESGEPRCRTQPEKLLLLAEGFSGDVHYGKTARGVLAYGERQVVALLDSTRAGETQAGVPIVATVNDALCFGPTTAVVGVATQGGRFPPAWRELLKSCIAKGLHLENGLHQFLTDDPELTELAARHGVELRDLRRPPDDLNVPTGANLTIPAQIVLTVGSDCAIGKMTVSLELERAARARGHRGALRPDRPDGNRDRGLGDRRRRGRLRLHRRRRRAARRRGSRARRHAAARRGAGSRHPSRVLRRHARADPRLRAAPLRALSHGGRDRGRGLSRPSAALAAGARRPARADLAARPAGRRSQPSR